jgi:hypothetical protein
LRILDRQHIRAVELSALRQNELVPLIEELDRLDLTQFRYIAFHAPSTMDPEFEPVAIAALEQVAQRQWPIILHPDAMHTPASWRRFGDLLCIENMDKRKPVGQTISDLTEIFKLLPNASLCFDIGHARQVDPTMSEATAILQSCKRRLRQVHISRKVAHLIPETVPVIAESRVAEDEVEDEIRSIRKALTWERLAAAGD